MIKALNEYGALSAKVRALYGKRLKYEDFQQIAGLSNLADVLDFLRTRPGWAHAASGFEAKHLDRIALESALREQIREEYTGLSAFIPRRDKLLASFPVLLAELEAIMAALRRLQAGRAEDPPQPYTRFLQYGRLNHDLARTCTDYDGLLAAARGTIYAPALLHLRADEAAALPDYTTAESLLYTAYFSTIYRQIHRQYAGQTRRVLLRAFGQQVDLLNIIHILRLKKYFPAQDLYLTVLFPFGDKLRAHMLRALAAAPDVDTAFQLLQDTPYADSFTRQDVAQVEDYYRRAFYLFNRKQLMLGTPSIYSAVAYLNLKELELKALLTAIESVNYGAVYDDTFASLLQ